MALSIPERRYDLAGCCSPKRWPAWLTTSATYAMRSRNRPAPEAARSVRTAARAAVTAQVARAERERALVELLEVQGDAPVRAGATIALRNCPFHALANEQRDLVCGMNREFLAGVIDGLGDDDAFDAWRDPQSGYCCVRVEPR